MDFEEYRQIKKRFESGESISLSVEKMVEYMWHDKVCDRDFGSLMDKVLEISKKLDALHNFTHGHIEGHPIFRDTITEGKCCCYEPLDLTKEDQPIVRHETPARVITRHEVDGHQVIFKNMGDL